MTVTHPFEPVYNADSAVLILGTIPSPMSRQCGFYYGHPQNSFWKVMAAVLETNIPTTEIDKKTMLLNNRIALWDVLCSCQIDGASDNTIKNPVVNNFTEIFAKSSIVAVYATGRTAEKLFNKYCSHITKAHYLPSTSSANRISFERLVEAYSVIKNYSSPVSYCKLNAFFK